MYNKREKLVLDNGLQVLLDPKPLEKCGVMLIVDSGNSNDVVPGTAHLLEHLQGAASKVYGDAEELNYVYDKNATTTYDITHYHFFDILPEHLDVALDNLLKVLSPVNIPVIDREKNAVRNEFSKRQNPFNKFNDRIIRLLSPNHSRYMYGIDESLNSLDGISQEDCFNFWNEHYNSANSVLYIGGEIPDDVSRIIKLWEKFEKKPLTAKRVIPEEPALESRLELREKIRQDPHAGITINYQIPMFPKNASLEECLTRNILINYFKSSHGPLYKELRDETGLCYSLDLEADNLGDSGILSFGATTGFPEKAIEIEERWNKILKDMAKTSVPNSFLKTYKNGYRINRINSKSKFDVDGLIDEFKNGVDEAGIRKAIEGLNSGDVARFAQSLVDKNYLVGITLPLNHQD